jgi:amidohydrolase
MTKLLSAAQTLQAQMSETYRELHRYPELSHGEVDTAQRIARWLRDIGLTVQEGVGGHGVVAILAGTAGSRTLALRADMDALPIEEQSGCDFASQYPGRMHACGHDAHMTMLLYAARLLKERQAELGHNVKFIFQPAEEYTPPQPGASRMVSAGVLENPKVDAIVALHIWPAIPAGRIGVNSGACMVAFDVFEFELTGPGGHGALPNETSDVVVAAAAAIMGFQTIVSRRLSPLYPAVLTVGSVESGTKPNIIPTRVVGRGSSRYLLSEQSEGIRSGMEAILRGAAEAYGVGWKLDYHNALPATINDAAVAKLVHAAGQKVLGPEQTDWLPDPVMVSEDFSLYMEKVPGCMFFLGNGNNGEGTGAGLHSAFFRVNESILPLGAAVLAQAAIDFE